MNAAESIIAALRHRSGEVPYSITSHSCMRSNAIMIQGTNRENNYSNTARYWKRVENARKIKYFSSQEFIIIADWEVFLATIGSH